MLLSAVDGREVVACPSGGVAPVPPLSGPDVRVRFRTREKGEDGRPRGRDVESAFKPTQKKRKEKKKVSFARK